MLTLDELALVGLLISTATATSHFYVAALGFSIHRHRSPAASLFALSTGALAWATGITGLSRVIGQQHHTFYVLSSLFSGYGAPALLLFIRRCVDPRRVGGLGWLALGLPGSVFALLCLLDPALMDFVVAFRAGQGPAWNATVSPFYLAHALQSFGCLVAGAWILARALRLAPPGPYREGLWWLVGALAIGLVGVLLLSVLPGALRIQEALAFAPLATLPTLAFGYRALGLHADASRSAWTPRVEADRRRMESVAGAIRGLSEEVGLALGQISTQSALLVGASPGDRDRYAGSIRELAAGAGRIVAQMVRFAGVQAGPPTPVAAGPLLRSLGREAGASVALTLAAEVDEAWVNADVGSLERALRALLDNAQRAGPGTVRVRAGVEPAAVVPPAALGAELDGSEALRVEVEDRGLGMEAAVLDRALEPFFSGWGRRGLGLVEVTAAIRLAGGAFALRSSPGNGTVATLWLPRARAPEAAAVERLPAVLPGAVVHVLVDADPRRRELMCLLLQAREAEVFSFALAPAAMDWLETLPADVRPHLCVEAPCPGWSALVRALRGRWPGAPAVLVTDDGLPVDLGAAGAPVTVFSRPLRPRELVALLLSADPG